MSQEPEIKSVEKQQKQTAAPRVDPAITHSQEAESTRRRQALMLQRERILSERTSSPHRRSALELALAEIERLLQELGYSIKL